ncbi:MAG: competence protein ComK [Acholeplasmataceae bacterium]|nr:competence protein ComK [Acholeplasmataceae bacterium]
MIEYIKNDAYGCYVFQNGKSIHNKSSNLSYIKKLCYGALFTYEGYLKAVQINHGKSYKIPLYIDDDIMLIPSGRARDFENIWINYAAIKQIIDMNQSIEVVFNSNSKLMLNISINAFKRQISYLRLIRNEKVKHFHS